MQTGLKRESVNYWNKTQKQQKQGEQGAAEFFRSLMQQQAWFPDVAYPSFKVYHMVTTRLHLVKLLLTGSGISLLNSLSDEISEWLFVDEVVY